MTSEARVAFVLFFFAVWCFMGLIPWAVAAVVARGRGALTALPMALAGACAAGVAVPLIGADDFAGFLLSLATAFFAGAVASAAGIAVPAIEINYVIPPEGVEALLSNDHVGIVSLHSPTPRIKIANGKSSDALNLASTNEEERVLAVERARVTVDHAARCGARYM